MVPVPGAAKPTDAVKKRLTSRNAFDFSPDWVFDRGEMTI
jgi:hypothetical protein